MIHRARLLFVGAVVAALVVVGAEFPLSQLMSERHDVATTSAELTRLEARNRWLAGQVAALHDPSVVGRIAHEQYGLVERGQRSVVVLPGPGAAGGADPLAASRIPTSDLVPSDSLEATPQDSQSGPPQQSFLSKLIERLEFWKAAS